ncbi:hypothetical protein AAGV87_004932, partial [Escherichia coli]|nr:hypothetical protein [Escherichia coli]ELB9050772.1 hypothetical protein [Escherichia coli]ELB9614073.1 hypothetical protein [Escherichia coli]ELB9657137.1 hypothetical protein [Escherichia coli]ELS3292709.1 hypothetical protein [Escherichia coli]
MTKTVSTSKKPRKQQNQQTSSERELEMSTEIARLKRQLAERDEELAILQKAATYFAK